MMERHGEHKQRITDALQELAILAGEIGVPSLREEMERVRLPKLAEERFNLVVLGEFNHGKTTFVNALLGRALLPVGITPTTATLNHIVWAEVPRARAVPRDGAAVDIDVAELAQYLTLEGAHAEETRFVELGYPATILRDKVTLVDTPGVNDLNEARAEITYSYIPAADAVIFLLDATQVLKHSERIFIQKRLLQRSRDKLIFILGKADLLSKEELRQALDFAGEHLSDLVEDPVIFALSPRLYLEGKIEESGVPPFLDFLRRYLDEQRGRVLLDNTVGDSLRTISYLRSSLGIKQTSLSLSLEELVERIARVKQRLAGSRRELQESHARIRSSAEAIKATIRHDLKLFVEAFCRAIPGEVDRSEVADIKRYLQFFIQDKFKEWAEQEGDKAAQLLEGLAEEIIQITNDNVHRLMSELATGFGSAETRVDLEIDTLRYDVSVFALGALGTTVFLFVNVFVGGLLTLATPFLAVVLRDKVEAKIKEQAKARGSEVVRHAADAISPRFEAIVDRFSEKLDEFVANAGETLYRGISEILDQTLAERREQVRAAEPKERIAEQQEHLGVLEEKLLKLREEL